MLATRRSGQGQPVVLVHGGLTHGDLAWGEQRILEERWTLVVPDRVGYGDSADLGDGEDFDRDAELIADDLDQGSHLVGYSSGSMAAMLAAARRPEAVASLTVIEPPAFHLAPGSAAASELLKANQRLWDSPGDDPVGFLKDFFALNRIPQPPDEALRALSGPTRVWQRFVRRPWEGDFGLDELAAAPFPKLVISGGHGQAFEDICDAIAARLSAERAVITALGTASSAPEPRSTSSWRHFCARRPERPPRHRLADRHRTRRDARSPHTRGRG